MPYNWTPAAERQMLLLAITKANLKPTSETWVAVASLLGNGLTPSAISQKFYKLRNECAQPNGGLSGTSSAQSTPRKRKRDRRPQPVIDSNSDHELHDVRAIDSEPTPPLATRPLHKVHLEDQVDDVAAEESPVKKQKAEPIKKEQFDALWHEEMITHVPQVEKGVDASSTNWILSTKEA